MGIKSGEAQECPVIPASCLLAIAGGLGMADRQPSPPPIYASDQRNWLMHQEIDWDGLLVIL